MIPLITKPAPQFKGIALLNGSFQEISLSDYQGQYVVLFYYPLNFNYECPTEIIAFSDRADDFRSKGCVIIGASTESPGSHLAWCTAPRKQGGLGHLDMPLLSDKTMNIARAYGILDENAGIPFRGLFIIDRNQNLRQVTINDLRVGRSADEILRLVQAFQYTDVVGEVCPANWRPGARTMVPETSRAREYFAHVDAC